MKDGTHIQPSLIFIPDITGFTSFINSVEVNHSTHIIAELLEIIIESNILDLKISEIEGDAVLFYKLGTEVSTEDIFKQASVMFIEFHRHLKLYDTQRVCQCGACSSVNDLSLKFISHIGNVKLVDIKGHKKLFGPDVTTAHRLLKNSIDEKEYLLTTLNDQNSIEEPIKTSLSVKNGSDFFDDIGKVLYHYYPLLTLKSKLSEIDQIQQIEKYQNPVSSSNIMHGSLKKVHGIVTDISLKPKWIFGLKSVREDSDKLSRIGSEHLCLMPAMSMNFKITSQKLDEGAVEYSETTNSLKWFSAVSVFYQMIKLSDNQTKMTISVHYKHTKSTFLFDIPIRLMILIHIKLSLWKLNRYLTKQIEE